jgi:AcrR family transcriptional regulator
MARTKSIKYDRVLEAARAAFLDKGPSATMAEIARRAGVAEGTLYRFVDSKDELLRRATDVDGLEPSWLTDMLARVGRGELTTELVEAGMRSLGFFRTLLAMLMIRGARPKASYKEDRASPLPPQVLKQTTAFFAAEQQLGRIHKKVDPDVVGRAFLGGLMSYAIYEMTLRGPQPPAEGYVRALVRLLFGGCAPR